MPVHKSGLPTEIDVLYEEQNIPSSHQNADHIKGGQEIRRESDAVVKGFVLLNEYEIGLCCIRPLFQALIYPSHDPFLLFIV